MGGSIERGGVLGIHTNFPNLTPENTTFFKPMMSSFSKICVFRYPHVVF